MGVLGGVVVVLGGVGGVCVPVLRFRVFRCLDLFFGCVFGGLKG